MFVGGWHGLLGWVRRESRNTRLRDGRHGPASRAKARRCADRATAADDGVDVISHRSRAGGPGVIGDAREVARQQLRDGRVDLAIVIPEDLLQKVVAGERPTFTVFSPGTEPAADAAAFGKLQGVLATLARELVPPGANPPVIPQIEHETVYLTPDADQVTCCAILRGFFGLLSL